MVCSLSFMSLMEFSLQKNLTVQESLSNIVHCLLCYILYQHSYSYMILLPSKIFFFWLANFAEGGYSDLFPRIRVLNGDSLVLVCEAKNDTFCKSVERLSQKDVIGWRLNDMYLQINSDCPNSERYIMSKPK